MLIALVTVWVVIAPFVHLALVSNYCFTAMLLELRQCSFVLTSDPFSSQLSTQLLEWRFSVSKDWVATFKIFRLKHRSVHTGSVPMVYLPTEGANVTCLWKRRIRQIYTVFYFLLHYCSYSPNFCAWGMFFIISACFFFQKLFHSSLELRKLLLCLISYSKFYFRFLNQFLKHCRVHLGTDTAIVLHVKWYRSGLF